MRPTDCYCPQCGKHGLQAVRAIHGLTIMYCDECQIELAIIIDPEIEGSYESQSTETTH